MASPSRWQGKRLLPVLVDPKVSFALTFRFLGRLGIAPVDGSIAGEAPGGMRPTIGNAGPGSGIPAA
ncbi:hypothetical protein HPB50_008406 [Hyalomma asiaticum]|uniref:Uncharacterized protein n=1 Tax=Hyalomma asiaticum TaxID=266040 RepID=A0ACB7RPS8_HYAAI|nr:hypothetical protein HPB50_008406 [Hyalomma asiaticum]